MLYWCVIIVAERKISEDFHQNVNYTRMAELTRERVRIISHTPLWVCLGFFLTGYNKYVLVL